MATNILNLSFRRTHTVSLASAIKQYISTKYDQHPDMFAQDLAAIDDLRRDAVTCLEPHPSGIRKIEAYAAQLVWMGGKFPTDFGADFTWYSSLGYNTETPVSQNDIRFELANILFNLAALFCQLAVESNRSTPDGLKKANNYFCQSAGIIKHLKTEIVPEMHSAVPEDMDVASLECLEHLLLAQAQECFWQKAVKDSMTDGLVAKLAASVSDLYSQASDFAVKSNSITSEWIHHMSAKHHHFAAAAQYRAACDCLEKRKYGEEVARLRDSLACVAEGLRESRYIGKGVIQDLQGLRDRCQEDLRRAEKDNDVIYLQAVPPKSELTQIGRKVVVLALTPKEVSQPVSTLGTADGLGKPLFAQLVPYSVHVAASIYSGRRDKAVKDIIDSMESLTNRVHDLMKSLKLPGSLQALEKPLGLPPGLTSHAEEIRQQNGPQRIRQFQEDVAKLKTSDRQAYEEGLHFLKAEADEDEQARRKYGTDRWNRGKGPEVAAKLYGNVTEYGNYLKSAEESDQKVRDKIAKNEKLINLLNGVDRDLENFVPSSRRTTLTPALEREASKLRSTLNDVGRLESRRKRRIDDLKQKAQDDDVNPDLLKEAARLERELPMQTIEAVQFEQFFNTRLEKYTADEKLVAEEKAEQDKLLSKLAEANTGFITARRGDASTKDRERALQKLENAYFAYKEILHELDMGRGFYNQLAGIVGNFREEARAFAYSRRVEAAQLEADISTILPMANLSLQSMQQSQPRNAQPPQQPTSHQPQQQQQRPAFARQRTDDQNTIITTTSQTSGPMPAPLPVKPAVPPPVATHSDAVTAQNLHAQTGPVAGVWTPDVGIKFGGVATPNGGANAVKDGRWEPGRGVKFG